MFWTLQPFSAEILLTIFLRVCSLKSFEKKIRTASRSTKFCEAELDAISAESAIQASHEGIVLHGSNGDTLGLAFV
jgi:hypothetical protein